MFDPSVTYPFTPKADENKSPRPAVRVRTLTVREVRRHAALIREARAAEAAEDADTTIDKLLEAIGIAFAGVENIPDIKVIDDLEAVMDYATLWEIALNYPAAQALSEKLSFQSASPVPPRPGPLSDASAAEGVAKTAPPQAP